MNWKLFPSPRLIALLVLAAPCGALNADATGAGYLERAYLLDADALALHAKLDTGADSSSLDVADLQIETRGNARWVVFAVRDRGGHAVTLERPLLRTARIKRSVFGVEERPVVELTLCLGGVSKVTPVNLADRSNMKYPLLLGRDFLAGAFIVDAARTYRLAESCRAAAAEPVAVGVDAPPQPMVAPRREAIEPVPARGAVKGNSAPGFTPAWQPASAAEDPPVPRATRGIDELLELGR
ncbi:MAG: ATP-dependent zinc protease [Thiotrichales bacterium]